MSQAAIDLALAALADPARRRAVEALARGPSSAGDLARTLGLSPPTLSKHLKVLKAGGLVEDSHPSFDARVRVYALRREGLGELGRWLAEAEAMWTGQLAALKAHVEVGT